MTQQNIVNPEKWQRQSLTPLFLYFKNRLFTHHRLHEERVCDLYLKLAFSWFSTADHKHWIQLSPWSLLNTKKGGKFYLNHLKDRSFRTRSSLEEKYYKPQVWKRLDTKSVQAPQSTREGSSSGTRRICPKLGHLFQFFKAYCIRDTGGIKQRIKYKQEIKQNPWPQTEFTFQ